MNGVCDSFREFHQANGDRPIVFLVERDFWPETNKSGAWLTGAVMERFPQYRDALVFSARVGEAEALKSYLQTHRDAQIVMVDDVGYSGEQLSLLAESTGEKRPDRFHVVTSHLSAAAITRLKSRAQIYFKDVMPNVDDLLAQEAPDRGRSLRRALAEIFSAVNKEEPGQLFHYSVTTVDYQLADLKSFPAFLAKGRLIRRSTSGRLEEARGADGHFETHPFLRAGTSGYKEVPPLDPSLRASH